MINQNIVDWLCYLQFVKCYPSNLTFFGLPFWVKAYWRDAGYSGEVVSNGGDRLLPGCSSGPISIVYDATTDSGVAALVGFIAGQHATEWKAKTVAHHIQSLTLDPPSAALFEPLKFARASEVT